MIESSMMVNDQMPQYCVDRAARALNENRKPLNGSRVLVLGVAYKQDIDDYRESPALSVMEILESRGAEVVYFDPWVAKCRHGKQSWESLGELSAKEIEKADLVMITAAHSNVDYGFVQAHAKLIFDTKNATKSVENRSNIEVL